MRKLGGGGADGWQGGGSRYMVKRRGGGEGYIDTCNILYDTYIFEHWNH